MDDHAKSVLILWGPLQKIYVVKIMKHAFFFGADASAHFGMPVTKKMLEI